MKTILVATDFSDASNNAVNYGAGLASAFNARLILFHVYQVPVPISETPIIISREDIESGLQEKMQSETARLNFGETIKLTTDYKEGPAANTILKAAREAKADLIIAGMKKTGKGVRRIFGSVVTTLARKANMPLLVVPEEAKYAPVNTIALANENDLAPDADHHTLDSLREIAERFHSKVYLVRIAEDRFKEAFEVLKSPFKLTRMLRTLDPVYESIEGKNIPVALDDFALRYHVDILAMLPHKHSLMERLFFKSATREMVFEAHLPLLILPDLHKEGKEHSRSEEDVIM